MWLNSRERGNPWESGMHDRGENKERTFTETTYNTLNETKGSNVSKKNVLVKVPDIFP